MKIYTRTGDRGDTGLFGGGRVRKDHARVEAYGAVDELNAVIGAAIAALAGDTLADIADGLVEVQADLFALGAHLATPTADEGGRASDNIPPLPTARIAAMEGWIDRAEEELEPLRSFILPGGCEPAARLHIARTVCRRSERRVISLADSATVDESLVVYLNRLSDLLFTLARLANRRAGAPETPWMPRQ